MTAASEPAGQRGLRVQPKCGAGVPPVAPPARWQRNVSATAETAVPQLTPPVLAPAPRFRRGLPDGDGRAMAWCSATVGGRWITRRSWPVLLCVLTLVGCQGSRGLAGIQSADPRERSLAIREAAEAKDARAIPLLVDRLEDEDDGVRFYAILGLERITGERFGYHYSKPARERAGAVERWRAYVEGRGHGGAKGGGGVGVGPEASAPGSPESNK